MPIYTQLDGIVERITDAVGDVAAGGTIEIYEAGTSTPTTLFSDNAGTATPTVIDIDDDGMPSVSGSPIQLFYDTELSYKLVIKDSLGVQIYPTMDNVGSPIIAQINELIQQSTYAADTGSADAYAIAITGITSYVEGQTFRFKATNANTGASTLNVNSLGVKSIKKGVSETLEAGDIEVGAIITVIYDGTNFQMDVTEAMLDLLETSLTTYIDSEISTAESGLQSQITSNDSDISTLQTDVTAAESDISTLQTDVTALEAFNKSGDQTSTSTGTLNNFALSSSTRILKFTGTTAPTITGITGGSGGRELIIVNNASSGDLTLSDQSASSTPLARIITYTGVAITAAAGADNAFYLIYDDTSGRWRAFNL